MGVFDTIYALSHASLKFWGLIAENEPMLLLATLLAAEAKGFKLESFAQSLDDQLAQCRWSPIPRPVLLAQPDQALSVARQAAADYLQKKGEPATYQQIHAAAITGMAEKNLLAIDVFLQNINQGTSETQRWVESIFNESDLLTRVTGDAATLEAGEWWLTHPEPVKLTLMDYLEEHVYSHLVSTPTTTAHAVKTITHQALPGIFTPEDESVLICLSSYANLADPQTHLWTLRDEEVPAAREVDRQALLKSLNHVAQRLGYLVSGSEPLYWHEYPDAPPRYRIHILTTAIVSPFLSGDFKPAETNILVIPGSRSNLLAFKEQRDPILRATLAHNFSVVKFRLIRDLEVNPLLSRELFQELIGADPPEYRAAQLALL
jgi:hypothetical protein